MTAAGDGPVLLHAHLFKNAGTTFDWSLKRHFGDRFCDHRDDVQMRGNSAYLKRFLEENNELQALSSHWLPLPPPSIEDRRLLPVLFLRDPIERIASVYEFERRQELDHPGTLKARESSFQDYVRWRLEERTGPVIRNYQVRMLSGAYPGDGSEQQFERALALLDALPVVGLVECYRQSIVLIERALTGEFPGLDLSFRPQNVRDASDQRSHRERRASVESRLGPLREAVIAANQYDLRLYAAVKERFQRAWHTLEHAGDWLSDLDQRCALLGSD
jgi:hypothetical protein